MEREGFPHAQKIESIGSSVFVVSNVCLCTSVSGQSSQDTETRGETGENDSKVRFYHYPYQGHCHINIKLFWLWTDVDEFEVLCIISSYNYDLATVAPLSLSLGVLVVVSVACRHGSQCGAGGGCEVTRRLQPRGRRRGVIATLTCSAPFCQHKYYGRKQTQLFIESDLLHSTLSTHHYLH